MVALLAPRTQVQGRRLGPQGRETSEFSRLLKELLELEAFGADYITNPATQRQRVCEERGALHLTRSSDLLDHDVPAPDFWISNQP